MNESEKSKIQFLVDAWESIIIETNETEPEWIATITQDDVEVNEQYRLRLKPIQ